MTKDEIKYAWEGIELLVTDDTDAIFFAGVKLIHKVSDEVWKVEFNNGIQTDYKIRGIRIKNIEDSLKVKRIVNREKNLNHLLD